MSAPDAQQARSTAYWVGQGALNLFSLPALVLMAAQVGFAALAREAGFSLTQTVFMTFMVWALPSQVVFVGIVGSGASLFAVVLAVGLSAVRFMPMVMAWVPLVRTTTTRRWMLLGLSWFVAITAWVFAMAKLPDLPRPARAPFFAGFAVGLTLSNLVVVGLAYALIGTLPDVVAAALVFLTPIYFLMALWGAARMDADKMAMAAGLILGPLFAMVLEHAHLLVAGVVGGTFAYGVSRWRRRRPGR
ncbi:MAG: AzlC family ABC transporter permease [Devosia sp.]